MKLFLIALLCLSLVACGDDEPPKPVWQYVEGQCMEPKYADKAAELTKQLLMSSSPKVLSGHDQDWDDAIQMAALQASILACPPIMREMTSDKAWAGVTGRWHYAGKGGAN